jgi:hypothetical protein
MADVPVTVRAVPMGALHAMQSAGVGELAHTLPITPRLCPRSGNPLPGGTLRLTYRPAGLVAEVVSLLALLHEVERQSRSVEEIPVRVATAVSVALGVAVSYQLDVTVDPGPQRMEVRGAILPRNA